MRSIAKTLFACAFVLFSTTPISTVAQESDNALLKEIRDSLNDLGALANNTIEEAMTLVAEMAYPSTPNVSETMLVNINFKQLAIPYGATESNNRLNNTMSLFLNPLSLHQSDAARAYQLMPSEASQVSTQLPNFEIGSILNKTGIQTGSTDAIYAQNFINAIIDLENTPKNLNFIAFAGLSNPGANYLTALGSFIALQSVPIKNLYDMYAKRIIVPNLGKNAGMIRLYPLDENDQGAYGQEITDASPHQVDEYMANRRVMNPKWYTDMESAAPSTVQREILYVLAEIRQEMHRQRMDMEKLTANIASLQLQQSQENNRAKFLIKPLG